MAAVEHADHAAPRRLGVVAPQEIVIELVARRHLERRHRAALRVHALEHGPDRPVLAAGIDRLEHEQQAARALGIEPLLQRADALALLAEGVLGPELVEAAIGVRVDRRQVDPRPGLDRHDPRGGQDRDLPVAAQGGRHRPGDRVGRPGPDGGRGRPRPGGLVPIRAVCHAPVLRVAGKMLAVLLGHGQDRVEGLCRRTRRTVGKPGRSGRLRSDRILRRLATIYFIRHGQTAWNAEGRLQGSRDIDLNPQGEAQAVAVAERLAAVAGPGLAEAEFLASPLKRTRRTMEILRTTLGLPPGAYRTDPRLREIGFGTWEGSTWAEIRRRDPGGASARDRERWNHRPPGLGGESYATLVERVGPVLADLQGMPWWWPMAASPGRPWSPSACSTSTPRPASASARARCWSWSRPAGAGPERLARDARGTLACGGRQPGGSCVW